MKLFVSIATEYLIDLGVTVAYATLVGLVIGAVTLSDGGLASLFQALAYSTLLPLAVLIMIVVDAALRALAASWSGRRRIATRRYPGAARPALR